MRCLSDKQQIMLVGILQSFFQYRNYINLPHIFKRSEIVTLLSYKTVTNITFSTLLAAFKTLKSRGFAFIYKDRIVWYSRCENIKTVH